MTTQSFNWRDVAPESVRISGKKAEMSYCSFTGLPQYEAYRFPFDFELKVTSLGGCRYRMFMNGGPTLFGGSLPAQREHPELVPTSDDAPAIQAALAEAIRRLEAAAAEFMKDMFYHLHGRGYVEDNDDDRD